MEEKIILITGATSGFGKAAATELAKLGATVVVGCSNSEKGHKTLKEIEGATGSKKLDLFIADLSSQKQIIAAAAKFKQKYKKLDVLINNAGVYLPERQTSEDGFEKTLATNYLSHFLLTHLMLDYLKKAAPSRIINVASRHNGIRINWDDIMLEKKYAPWQALGQTKLAQVIITKKLARELEGTGVTINSLHPAVAVTGLGVYKATGLMGLFVKALKLFIHTSVDQGAQTHVYLASSPEVKGVTGEFFINKKVVKTGENANNPNDADRLWNLSLKLTKISKF